MRESSMDWSTVAERSSKRKESRDFIEDSVFQSWVFLSTELSILEPMMLERNFIMAVKKKLENHLSLQDSFLLSSLPLLLRPLPIHLIQLEEDWWWHQDKQLPRESILVPSTVLKRSLQLKDLLDSSRAIWAISGDLWDLHWFWCYMMNSRNISLKQTKRNHEWLL